MKIICTSAKILLISSISSLICAMDNPEKAAQPIEKILWLECKAVTFTYTTGREDSAVLEIAAAITDKWLHPLVQTEKYVMAQPSWLLDRIKDPSKKEECIRSGLWEKAKASKLEIYKAEAALIAFIDKHFPNSKPVTYINDCWGMGDVATSEMSGLNNRINLQVFGFDLEELVKLWDPEGTYTPNKPGAKDTGFEQLNRLQHYRERYFDKEGK